MASSDWQGFSPLAANPPMSVTMSPEHAFGFATATLEEQPDSPLVFRRTPVAAAVSGTPGQDSAKRFNSWVQSTSPYAGRKTPPTASMKSCVADGEENTPPAARESSDAGGSQHHFQAWLRATSSNSWTPRKSPAAGTPPPAPAPSPAAAGTPMSIMRELTHSAATPAAGRQQQHAERRVVDSGDALSSDNDDDAGDFGEASTTVGMAQLDAAARRTAAAAAAVGGSRRQAPTTPPRVPASTPEALTSPQPVTGAAASGSGPQQQLLQTAADSLATPLSHMSLGRGGAMTPLAAGGGTGGGVNSSPAEKLIGLMLSPGGSARGSRAHHHHHQQHTPSRLAGAAGGSGDGAMPPPEAPLSPNLQVINLMISPQDVGGAAAVGDAAAAAAAAEDGCSDGGYSSEASVASVSEDEMDVAELQALCGGAGPDTPLSAILGMMLTPKAACLTTSLAAPSGQQAAPDDLNPRVLFGDD